jgi:hypothetical protein
VSEASDVVSKPARLDRGVIPIMVLLAAVGGSLWLGFWWRDREAAEQLAVLNKINQIERVFTERANALAASSSRDNEAALRAMERMEGRILAAIEAAGHRVSAIERDVREWVALLDAQNGALVVPKFGK